MTALALVPPDDPILHTPVPEFAGDHAQLRGLAAAMLSLCSAGVVTGTRRITGVGLAAPQVGHAIRMFVLSIKGGRDYVCINPRAVSTGRPVRAFEQCLSVLGNQFVVERSSSIVAGWYDLHGQRCEAQFTGPMARAFAHELDHLAGRVIWPGLRQPTLLPDLKFADGNAVAVASSTTGDAQGGGE